MSNKIKIGEKYNDTTNNVDEIYANYDYCICIKDIKVETVKWIPNKSKKFAHKGEIFKYVRFYDEVLWNKKDSKYAIILEETESFYDRWDVVIEQQQFDQHFMKLTEWRNRQLDNIGII